MKKLLTAVLITSLLLSLSVVAETTDPAAEASAAYLTVAEDVHDIAFNWEKEQMIQLSDREIQVDLLHLQYEGFRSNSERPDTNDPEALSAVYEAAKTYAQDDLLIGEFVLAVPTENADRIYFSYSGNGSGSDNGDVCFVDYDSYYRGEQSGQIKRVYYDPADPLTVYAQFYFPHTGIHNAVKIKYLPESTSWKVDRFDADTLTEPFEAQIAAAFHYLDFCRGYKVTVENGSLNIRNAPNGDVINEVFKDEEVTVFRTEFSRDDGMVFTLIEKLTEPDAEGRIFHDYFGWCAAQYLTCGSEANWESNSTMPDEEWIAENLLSPGK